MLLLALPRQTACPCTTLACHAQAQDGMDATTQGWSADDQFVALENVTEEQRKREEDEILVRAAVRAWGVAGLGAEVQKEGWGEVGGKDKDVPGSAWGLVCLPHQPAHCILSALCPPG